MNRCNNQWSNRWSCSGSDGTASTTVALVEPELRLPLDLREWITPETLAAWVQEEIAKLNWTHPEVQRRLSEHPDYQPQTMLRLLTLAYATGAFSSQEIVRKCHTESLLQSLCQGGPPFAQELKCFRHKNRGLLGAVLHRVSTRALREKLHLTPDPLVPELERLVADNTMERL
ncbi:MAG TPA: transposase, partial [Bacillota bacterium]|nr:transposase [Bacillota bacterium]